MTYVQMQETVTAFLLWLEQKPMVNALLLLMLMDIASGLCMAVVQKNLCSTISWRGMMKKVLTLLALGVAMVIEPFVSAPLAAMVAFCFICTEALSILENAAKAGVKLPVGLIDALSKINESSTPKPGHAEVKIEVSSNPTDPNKEAKTTSQKITL